MCKPVAQSLAFPQYVMRPCVMRTDERTLLHCNVDRYIYVRTAGTGCVLTLAEFARNVELRISKLVVSCVKHANMCEQRDGEHCDTHALRV